MLAVIADRIDPRWVDDDGTVMADRLLQPRMAVIPIGARLLQRELIDEGLARLDAGEADPRHAVHLERQQQAVPVDRGVLVQGVRHRQAHVLALAHPQQGRGQQAVDGEGVARSPADGEVGMAHRQVDVRPRQRRQIGPQPRRTRLRPGGHQARKAKQPAARSRTAQQGPAIESHARHGGDHPSCTVPRQTNSTRASLLLRSVARRPLRQDATEASKTITLAARDDRQRRVGSCRDALQSTKWGARGGSSP
ncbi:hypothetical protein D3C72_1106890 [compost metagenome]